MPAAPPVVHGHCEPAFEPLRGALSDILAAGSEIGAALAVYVDTHAVVDVWAGHTDAARTRPWERDTIVNLYSVGKAVTAVCALRLVDAGALDLDAPISRYWPEFAQAGKAQMPVRFLLTHQAGLPAVARPLPPGAVLRWEIMTDALAAQAAWWPPGESQRPGAHARACVPQPAGDFRDGDHQHTAMARGGSAVDERPRECARGGAALLGARRRRRARRRAHPLPRDHRDGDRGAGVRRGYGPAAPHALRARIPAHHGRATPGPEPACVRALRCRRLAGVCRSRRAARLRLCHEPGARRLAAQARPPPHRSGL